MIEASKVKRVLGYRRVSSVGQEVRGTSLDEQAESLVNFCKFHKLPPPEIFEDTESGSAEAEERRVGIQRLLRSVRPGDLVITTKIDRFSRDILFTISSAREIVRRGARFLSLAEQVDASTPNGEMQLGIWASIAQQERARIKERTEGNRKRLRALGKFVEGKPPFGYRRAKGADTNDKPRMLQIDPERAPVIGDIFALCLEGYSAREIAKHIKKRFGGDMAAFSATWVVRVLRNRVYTGQLALTPVRPHKHRNMSAQLPAEWVDAHEPIVTLETWSRAQDGLSRRRAGAKAQGTSKTVNWIMRGLARCSLCGTTICAAPSAVNGKTKHEGYYVCRRRVTPREDGIRCENVSYLRKDATDAFISRAIENHLASLRTSLKRSPIKSPHMKDFEAERAKLRDKRARLIDLFVDGTIDRETLKQKTHPLDARLAELDSEEASLSLEMTADSVENRRAVLAWIDSVIASWADLDVPTRRDVLASLAERIRVSPDRAFPELAWKDAPALCAHWVQRRFPTIDVQTAPAPASVIRALPSARTIPIMIREAEGARVGR